MGYMKTRLEDLYPARTFWVHPQVSAIHADSIHVVHRIFCVVLVEESDEGETPTFLGVAITRDVHIPNLAIFRKDFVKVLRRCAIRQIVHFQGCHALNVWRPSTVRHLWAVSLRLWK